MADALRAGTTIAHVALGGKHNSSNVKKGEERLSPCTQQEVVEAILVTAASSNFQFLSANPFLLWNKKIFLFLLYLSYSHTK